MTSNDMSLIFGHVGIGTIAPTANLDVDNSANASTAAVSINAAAGQATQLLLKRSGSTVSAFTNVSSDNSLRINNNGADRITINSSGNVGIGTTSPGVSLEVAGNIKLGFSGTIIQDARTAPTFLNSWSDYASVNGNYGPDAYYLSQDGRVYLRRLISSGSTASAVAFKALGTSLVPSPPHDIFERQSQNYQPSLDRNSSWNRRRHLYGIEKYEYIY